MILLSSALALVAIVLVVLFIRQGMEVKALRTRYEDIISVDNLVAERKKESEQIERNILELQMDHKRRMEQLNVDFLTKKKIYEELTREVSTLEENLENISYGLYKPHYDYQTSEEYKNQLEGIRNKQTEMIKSENAILGGVGWTVNGSAAEGKKMIKLQSKLMLRAFNGESEGIISRVSWSNIGTMETRLEKAFEAINKTGSSHKISITKDYFDLKIAEFRLEFELQEKLNQEKEEQRKIKDQIREEEKALREIEKAQKDAEKEEERYQNALQKARSEIEHATGKELEKLQLKVQEMEQQLKAAHEMKERAASMAQLTKSGHVYIISNIGSFGDGVLKIGMTRRLEPMDRVRELGDASVPFDFDVHAMIFSQNAPELENKLHKKFEDRRMNLVNLRSEFFQTNLSEIESMTKELGLNIQITKLAEAKEYRESLSIREARLTQKSPVFDSVIPAEKYPATLA